MPEIKKFGLGFAAFFLLFFLAFGHYCSLLVFRHEPIASPAKLGLLSMHDKFTASFKLGASGITVQTGLLEDIKAS
ncbi:MAG: hypothetical protein WC352_01655 [Candidatus Omnitrophota bacterium]|jgi:hypothetical protein